MNVSYPIKEKKPFQLYKQNYDGDAGWYPIGANNRWHSGIHLHDLGDDLAIRAIADGDIIAYRVTSEEAELETTYKIESDGKDVDRKLTTATISNNFVLIRHKITSKKKKEK
ncbi:MAG: hypothetical protein GY786_03585, partial [Proteobacteria bacterium]|nr:hypothetical protein [Pseudomonadota bacterium]